MRWASAADTHETPTKTCWVLAGSGPNQQHRAPLCRAEISLSQSPTLLIPDVKSLTGAFEVGCLIDKERSCPWITQPSPSSCQSLTSNACSKVQHHVQKNHTKDSRHAAQACCRMLPGCFEHEEFHVACLMPACLSIKP
jgi:hypothetical protein